MNIDPKFVELTADVVTLESFHKIIVKSPSDALRTDKHTPDTYPLLQYHRSPGCLLRVFL